MRYPEFLKENGRIGFIAPSFGCAIEPYQSCFDAALEFFRSQGYQTILGPNCYASEGVGKSNTPEKCAEEINDFFLREKSDIILSCGGGETMCENLPFVDLPSIAQAPPRWFMGYSDNTNLTFTLPTLCDTAAIYGPCAPSFGMQPQHPALMDAFSLLKGEKLRFSNYETWEKESLKSEDNPFAPYYTTEPYSMRFFPESQTGARFRGRLLGGCLDILQRLCGTPFDRVGAFASRYRKDGILWFLESCELSPFSIRCALWQLDQAGWFSHASGFLIGRPMMYGAEQMGLDCYDAVTDVLGKYSVPLLLDVDLGHLPPMMPLICGAVAEANAVPGRLTLQMTLK